MRADMHMHTVYSDGLLRPAELARRAKAAGVELISFTDHDTLAGDEEKRAAAEEYGLSYVRGWEISSYDAYKIHVLGYGCGENAAYFEFLEERQRGARLRAQDRIKKANAYFGLSLTIADAEKERAQADTPLHTMHVVRAYARRLNLSDEETYRLYFNVGKPADSGLCRPTPEQAIDVIHATGGFAVLAHPGRIHLEGKEREKLFDRLVAHGLDGIECVYTTHTASETESFLRYARARNLLQTGGSDFHKDDNAHEIGRPRFFAGMQLLAKLASYGGGR